MECCKKKPTVAIINAYYEHGFTSNRITRKDKGHTLINSKKNSVYTPFYVWKREQIQRRYRNHTHRLNEKELKA